MLDELQSGHHFVRALKGSDDGLELAISAWSNPSFRLPNKPQVILDWLLARYTKSQYLLDTKAWSLLLDIIRSSSGNSWLSAVLYRTPVVRLTTQFLTVLSTASWDDQTAVITPAVNCLCVIWRTSLHKIPVESQLDCFGTFLQTLRSQDSLEALPVLGCLLASTFRSSYQDSPNKKKLHSAFIDKHLKTWLSVLSSPQCPKELYSAVYPVGIELLFSKEVFRHDEISKYNIHHPLFSAFSSSDFPAGSRWQTLLAQVFSSFVSFLKENQNILFSSPSNADTHVQLRDVSLGFFSACHQLLAQGSPRHIFWDAVLISLQTIEKQRLLHAPHAEADLILQQLASQAVTDIADTIANGLDDSVMESIVVILRTRFETIAHAFPDILALMFWVSSPSQPVDEFLRLSLEHHCKIRRLELYAITAFDAILKVPSFGSLTEDVDYLQKAKHTVILQVEHLDRLNRALTGYLSATQVPSFVRTVRQTLERRWSHFLASLEGASQARHSPKRRKLSEHHRDLPDLVLYLTCELSCHFLQYRPLIPDSIREEHALEQQYLKDAVITWMTACLELVPWAPATQVALSGILRLHYALSLEDLVVPPPVISKALLEKGSTLMSGDCSPYLAVEIYRTLLGIASRRPSEADFSAVLESILTWLNATARTTPDAELPALFLRMLLQRWLPDLETRATSSQLAWIIEHILRCLTSESRFASHIATLAALRSAVFWELPKIKATFTTMITLWSEQDDHSKHMLLYSGILITPPEYMSKHTYSSLLRKGILTDLGQTGMTRDVSSLRTLRHSLLRMLSVQSFDLDEEFVLRYMQHLISGKVDSQQQLTDISVSLARELFLHLIGRGLHSTLPRVVGLINISDLSIQNRTCTLRYFALMGPILSKRRIAVSKLPESARETISVSLHQLRAQLTPLLQDWIEGGLDSGIEEVLGAWESTLQLQLVLNDHHHDAHLIIGRHLLRRFATSDPGRKQRLSVPVLSILSLELEMSPEDAREQHLEVIIASYVYLREFSTTTGLNDVLRDFISSLTAPLFKSALELVVDSLSASKTEHLDNIIHLSSMLLDAHPASTLLFTQAFFTSIVSLAANNETFTSPILRLQILQLLSSHCTQRPSSLRPVDLTHFWVLLPRLLSPARCHEERTSMEVFNQVVQILGAIIRLRRDLITSSLPQVASILRLLLSSLRQPRPLLGAKQKDIVASCLPSWVNPAEPLDLGASQGLSRLIESLTSKTLVRKRPNVDDVKAESLARPFSKHAAYVVKAYVDMMNDPLCMIPLEYRRALQPGLFALCSMMGTHNRDALMVSAFDVGGMSVMKALWADYEKQRYAGKE